MKVRRVVSFFLALLMTAGLSVGGVCAADAPEETLSASSTYQAEEAPGAPAAQPAERAESVAATDSDNPLLTELRELLLALGADQTQLDAAMAVAETLPDDALQAVLTAAPGLTAVELISRITQAAGIPDAGDVTPTLPPLDSFPAEDVFPVEGEPVESVSPAPDPVESLPAMDSFPGGGAPAMDSFPSESLPVESKPVESLPVESEPVESAPVESAPVESVPVESAPVEDAPAPEESAPVETLSEAELNRLQILAGGAMSQEELSSTANELISEGWSRAEIFHHFAAAREEVELYSTVDTGIVDVTVDASDYNIVVNPYNIPVDCADGTRSTDSIVMPKPITIRNGRESELKATAVATLALTNDVTAVANSIRGDGKSVPTDVRQVFLFMEAKPEGAAGKPATPWTTAASAKANADSTGAGRTCTLIPEYGSDKSKPLEFTVPAGESALLRVSGDCSVPIDLNTWRTAGEPGYGNGDEQGPADWDATAEDGFKVTVVFTFEPQENFRARFRVYKYDEIKKTAEYKPNYATITVDGQDLPQDDPCVSNCKVGPNFCFHVKLDSKIARANGSIMAIYWYEEKEGMSEAEQEKMIEGFGFPRDKADPAVYDIGMDGGDALKDDDFDAITEGVFPMGSNITFVVYVMTDIGSYE